MLKKIFLVGALLVPVLAYAGSPSTELSVQIVPAASPTPPPSNGIACDVGPNYTGSIPEPAQAEGYTHCAANYDFTTAQFSNLSSWLQCNDNGSGGYLFYLALGGPTQAPCSDISMITDAAKQTLDLTFTPTDWTNNVTYIQLQSTSRFGYPNPAGTLFPNGMYIEQVVRTPQSTFNSVQVNYGTLLDGVWSSGLGKTASPQTNIMEWDFDELYGGSGSNYQDAIAGEHCADNAGGFGCQSGTGLNQNKLSSWTPTVYHTYGNLDAVDTNGNYKFCSYVDGSPVAYDGINGCVGSTFYQGASDQAINSRNQLLIWTGAQNSSASCGSGHACSQPSGNVDFYIQRITIWSCSNWQSQSCAVANVPTSPP